MKKVLMTGASGIVGRNLLPILSRYYAISAPSRAELDILNQQKVDAYLNANKFEVLLHFAAQRPKTDENGKPLSRLAEIVHGFLSFERRAAEFEKIIYLGSGAEYDKSRALRQVREEEIGQSIPADDYGLAKYVLNGFAQKSANIYNLRIFGCYGPFEVKHKFICHAIDCCLRNESITIRQDCCFDYLYVTDLAEIIRRFIERHPGYHDYNVATGSPVTLSAIAKIVAEKMSNTTEIKIVNDDWNNEYTANNNRLLAEIGNFQFTPLNDGIDHQIEWQKGQK